MKIFILLCVVGIVCFLVCSNVLYADDITLLHEFAGGTNDGQDPRGSLVVSGSTLYGMTRLGGDADNGAILSINTDGSDMTILHEFVGGANDGSRPEGSLILSGDTMYGMTILGGSNGGGVIFSIGTDGTGMTLLHELPDSTDDGKFPLGSLILSGNTMYGMTFWGGDDNVGIIFSINTDGTDMTILHEFAGGADDGATPRGDLILSGSTLYGMTEKGGDDDDGVIFSIGTDGSGMTILHEFAGGADDGDTPYGSLVLSGSTMYGMTILGGSNASGVIFSIGTDGSDITLLHEFSGGADDGKRPEGSLVLSDSTLYGMTRLGGDDDSGVIFSIGTDGSGMTLLHEFAGGAGDGASPRGNLVLSGSTLYGMTPEGGDDDCGVIFSIDAPATTTTWYFAEGTTQAGYTEYITIANPNATDADVTVTFMNTSGTTYQKLLTVGATSRETVTPSDASVPAGEDIAATVTSTNNVSIIAERPIYLSTGGGHNTIGTTTPATTWYFAEGTTQAGYTEYITIANPNATDADVTVTFMNTSGTTYQKLLTVGATSRETVTPSDASVPAGEDIAATVTSTNSVSIIAERPIYLSTGGGHNTIGKAQN